MNRVCFYSDESYRPIGDGRRETVIAGAAICYERTNIRNALEEAERRSGKRTRDWHSSNDRMRERYIEAVLDIPYLTGRIYYYPFDAIYEVDRWQSLITTTANAIDEFTTRAGHCYHEVYPEGTPGQQRFILRGVLKRRGYQDVDVEYADWDYAEVRLSDALAGYVRANFYMGDGTRAPLTNIPTTFVNLER